MAAAKEETPTNRYKALTLLLPPEVKFVFSYVTWMEELAEYVEKSAFSKADSLEGYLKLILENEKRDQASETGKTDGEIDAAEDEDSDWLDNVGRAASKLNTAAMCTYIGDFDLAYEHLKHLKSEQLAKLKLTPKHLHVIEYFRDSLNWALGVLKGLEEQSNGGPIFMIQGSSKLNVKWEEISEDEDAQVKATLSFLKACLGAAMKVSEQVTLDLLIKATTLDPECHIWYHYAYRIMRRIRRNIKRTIGYKLARPSEEEERLAKKAFELCPEDMVTLSDYALMIKEKMWTCPKGVWDLNAEEYLKCAELFEKALKLAIELENSKWSRKIKVYLAEFLVFGKGDKLDFEAGKRMLLECAEEYPTSTFVLHKVGKLYHHGRFTASPQEREHIDLELAKDCYKRAIDSNPGNFACLMDYLKLLNRLKKYDEMILAIEKTLKIVTRDYQVAKLYVIKAYITWIHNPKNLADHRSVAVDELMFVLKNLPPEFAKEVCYTNDPIYFDRDHPGDFVKKEVIEYLETLKKNCQDEEQSLRIESFIFKLSKSVNRERRPRNDWNSNRKPPTAGEGTNADDLTEGMSKLSVFSSRGNQQRDRQKREWKPKSEGLHKKNGGSGEPGEENKRGGNRRRSEADEDPAWRKRDGA